MESNDPRLVVAMRIVEAIGGTDVPKDSFVKDLQVSDLIDWAETLVPGSYYKGKPS